MCLDNLSDCAKNNLHSLSYSLLRYALINEAGIMLTDNCLHYNSWHKPSLKTHPYIHFNLSHCSTAIAVGISFWAPIGIDVEAIREYSPYSLNRCFTKEEADYIKNSTNPNKEFFRLWTLKESYIKGIGIGMSYPMKQVSFNIKNSSIDSNKVKCKFLLIEDSSNYVTSCCYGVGKAMNNGKFHRIHQCTKNIFHG